MSDRTTLLQSQVLQPMRRPQGGSTIAVGLCLLLLAACSGAPSQGESQADTGRQRIFWGASEPELALEEERLWQFERELKLPEPTPRNHFILADEQQRVIGEPQLITARWEDTLSDLARAYGLGYDEIVAANPGVDPWMPGEGTTILLPTQYILPDGPQAGVVLNLASRRLFYYPPVVEGHRSVLTYPIGVGREGWDTPLGRTSIIAKTRDPAWNVPASIRAEHAAEGDPLPAVVPPGPDNPLGRYALRLGKSSYLLHGTNKPAGVGMRVSHGCVRLYPENIEQLFRLVDVGDRVTIVNQPYLLAWHQGELYLEAHSLPKDDVVNPERRLQALFDRAAAESDAFPGMSAEVQLYDVVVEARGVPVRLLRENVDQVVDRARSVQNLLAVNDIEPADLVY